MRLSTGIWPVESYNTFSITSQGMIMLPLLTATGISNLKETLVTMIYWLGFKANIRWHVKFSMRCLENNVSSSTDMQQTCNCQSQSRNIAKKVCAILIRPYKIKRTLRASLLLTQLFSLVENIWTPFELTIEYIPKSLSRIRANLLEKWWLTSHPPKYSKI
jgi:hypothetical protein